MFFLDRESKSRAIDNLLEEMELEQVDRLVPTSNVNRVDDEKLKDVFGGKKQVSMFDMTKLVSKHLK